MDTNNVRQMPPRGRERELLASGIAIGMSVASSSVGPAESSEAAGFEPVEPVTVSIGRSIVGPPWVPDGDIAEDAVGRGTGAHGGGR